MNIFEVAKYFLNTMPMTHKKLQKMCYYAYVWYYVLNNRPLFDNKFQAWEHGPVDPGLYKEYKKYRYHTIEQHEDLDINEDVMVFLNMIIDKYGDLNAGDLEDLSHLELPWKIARGDKLSFESSNDPIEDKYIKTFYLKEYGDISKKEVNFKDKIKEYREKELLYV
ncbi:Panacea domain-containing protein [Romboutsia ilealis]|uniref:Panacea domain-containing protein n=1 Tax=Romboutsia ilealis TaxID=1115758 RepID=UPI00289EA06D|nr:type II toxin-antitoxin system antitoxin SocA domain-containing protein [Romboutsia ilealis]